MAVKDTRTSGPEEGEVVITRVLDAPRALVFRAWTQPEHFVRWWGPAGFTTPYCTIDLRPGGQWHWCMRSPEGQDYWCNGVFREIVAPERIVSTQFFCDERGAQVEPKHYGMPAGFPAELLLTVTFAERDDKTTLTIRQSLPAALGRQIGSFDGWNGSIDKLAALLATVRAGTKGGVG